MRVNSLSEESFTKLPLKIKISWFFSTHFSNRLKVGLFFS